MKCLVTGGTGFIGRHLMSHLLSVCLAGDIVCVVEPDLKDRDEATVSAFRQAGVHVERADLTRPIDGPPPGPFDVVFHLAANTDTAASPAELSVNDLGTKHLTDWLGAAARGTRIVYSSSIAVNDRHGLSHGRPIDEASPCVPRTPYGETKLRGEENLRADAERYGYTYTILRLPTVYGPGVKNDGLFDTFATYAERQALVGRLNWPGRTSVIHVDDAADLMIGLAAEPAAANETFCVASPESPTVAELAWTIAGGVGQPLRRVQIPNWVWRFTRAVACNPVVYKLTPEFARQRLWRLSLIVDDGFWFDTSKLQKFSSRTPRRLAEGLAGTFDRTSHADLVGVARESLIPNR
jgi:UDP-glucose 4-epimerase